MEYEGAVFTVTVRVELKPKAFPTNAFKDFGLCIGYVPRLVLRVAWD